MATSRGFMLLLRSGAAALAFAGAAWGQLGQRPSAQRGIEPPPLSPAVTHALGLGYLSEEEKADRRVFHGVWTAEDLADTRRRAKAALTVGAWDDASLADQRSDADDRAEAAVLRGELDQALSLLDGRESLRAARLRAQALEGLGRFDEARAAVEPVVRSLLSTRMDQPAELVEGVRALEIQARLEGRPASDYQRMVDLLGRAQQALDRLHWPAILAQARLLQEKDNMPEAGKAALEVLTLNPSCAEAWALLGRMAVNSFDFTRAELVARKLTELQAGFGPQDSPGSAAGHLIVARAWLRQNDPAFAGESVGKALARFPGMREALALEAAVAALLFDFDAVERDLSEFDALSPGSPLALFEVGRALSEARQYDQAAAYLERAQERQPNWAEPVTELGLLEMQSGRDTRALAALRRATELDPFNVRARNSLRLIEELVTYETIETDHFVIRYPPGDAVAMAREMPGPLEELHRIVVRAIKHEPARKTVIELLPDHQWFAVRITGMTGIHTIAAATGPVIAMEAPREGKKDQHLGTYDWVRVVRHEYTHTVTLSRTNNRIPHWFTEAAAVYCENAPRDLDTCILLVRALKGDNLFDLDAINIAFVRPAKPTDRPQAYAQGHWMYQFIVKGWGADAPLALMDQYAKGVREGEAMRRVLGLEPDEFLAQFKEWARQDAAPWGLMPEPTLRTLLLSELLADPQTRASAEKRLADFAESSAWTLVLGGDQEELILDLPEPTPEIIERMAQRAPDHPDVLELQVGEALRLNDGQPSEGMIPLLERYAKARPVDPAPHRHLARLYLNSDEPERAVPHLEYLDVREQKSPAFAVELARRYASAMDWERAWAKVQRATWFAPFDPAYRELAASVAIKRGDLAEAERQVEALMILEPKQDIHRQRLERLRALRGG